MIAYIEAVAMKTSRNPYKKHIFVCTHQRENGEVSCSGAGERLCEALKERVHSMALKGRVRVSRSGCFDLCAQGPNVMIFPDHVWHGQVTAESLERIVEEHLIPLKKDSLES